MFIIVLIVLIIIYIIIGTVTYGIEFGYLQRKYPICAKFDYSEDKNSSVLSGILWPILFIVEYKDIVNKFKTTGMKFK